MTKLRQRLSHQEGFTLIELLIVIVIIGILLAIAVPSYLGFKVRANKRAAQSDVCARRSRSAEAYYSDNGKYTGMTPTLLKAIDTGLSADVSVASGTSGELLPQRHGRRPGLVGPRPRRLFGTTQRLQRPRSRNVG